MAGSWLYPLGAVFGLLVSAWAWERAVAPDFRPSTRQRHAIFLGCLVGAAIGAKLGYAFAEGVSLLRNDRLTWMLRAQALLQGKTVTGALLGAYFGVEVAKRRVRYAYPTGDRFALLAPLSLAIARLGCWTRGCCLGVPIAEAAWSLRDARGIARWPAVPLEFAFNLAFLAWAAWQLRRRERIVASGASLHGQLFHVYLMAYGGFRFAHEFLRDTPRWVGPFSGYHVLSLALLALGTAAFIQRAAQRLPRTATTSPDKHCAL